MYNVYFVMNIFFIIIVGVWIPMGLKPLLESIWMDKTQRCVRDHHTKIYFGNNIRENNWNKIYWNTNYKLFPKNILWYALEIPKWFPVHILNIFLFMNCWMDWKQPSYERCVDGAKEDWNWIHENLRNFTNNSDVLKVNI